MTFSRSGGSFVEKSPFGAGRTIPWGISINSRLTSSLWTAFTYIWAIVPQISKLGCGLSRVYVVTMPLSFPRDLRLHFCNTVVVYFLGGSRNLKTLHFSLNTCVQWFALAYVLHTLFAPVFQGQHFRLRSVLSIVSYWAWLYLKRAFSRENNTPTVI